MDQKNEWKKVEGFELFVRNGSKAGWIEVELRKEGSVKKFVMKKVDRFYSERDGVDTIVDV